MKHVSTHLLDGAPKVAGSPGTVSQARSQQGTSHGAKAKRHDGLLPAVRAREYRRFFREWFDFTQVSKIVDRKVSSTIWQQNGTKLTSTTFFAWKLFVTVCYDWPAFLDKTALTPNTNYWQAWTKMVRYTGMLLQPLLPLSLRGAFAYWRRRKQLPKVRFVPSAPQPPPPHTHTLSSRDVRCACAANGHHQRVVRTARGSRPRPALDATVMGHGLCIPAMGRRRAGMDP